MNLTVYNEAGPFLAKVRPILERNEAANSLILGNLLRLSQNPAAFKLFPYLALVEDAAEVVVVATMMRPPFELVLYCDRVEPGESLALIAQNLFENGWEVVGVLGPEKLTTGFASPYAALKGSGFRQGIRHGIFELTKVVPPRPVAGKLRVAQAKDVELLARWVIEFHKEALGGEFHGDAVDEVSRKVAQGGLFVWEDAAGQVVTMAGLARPTWHGTTVNAVYTPPEQRGKGYASASVAALSQHILDSGKRFATLFTDLSNPTSNSIYQKIGYNHILDFDELVFES